MSTRQLRLNSQNEIRKRLTAFTGKKINIVLNDQTAMLATLTGFDGSVLQLKNMRLKKISIPVENVSEIYFDTTE
ncbi:MAG TPA: hypothetical protein VEB86_03730 [Chryseosolibacter sp.]|nr:hypothetical protein [Chryseosolibacter sp.]